jgi:hypothetical protein
MYGKSRILFCLFHEFYKPVVSDYGFHPVEGFQVDNYRLFLVFGIRDIFFRYCGHAGVIPVFIRVSIKEILCGPGDFPCPFVHFAFLFVVPEKLYYKALIRLSPEVHIMTTAPEESGQVSLPVSGVALTSFLTLCCHAIDAQSKDPVLNDTGGGGVDIDGNCSPLREKWVFRSVQAFS